MFLTTVIPVYNVESYLRKAVESVLAGGIAPTEHEVILIDDGSTDGSGELADTLAREHAGVVKVVHKANGGVSSARNTGIDMARGTWLHFMDSDDWIIPDSYSYLRDKYMFGMAPADYLGFHSVTMDNVMRACWVETLDKSGEVVFEGTGREYYYTGKLFCFVWQGLFRTEFLRTSGVRFDEDMCIGEDTDFMMRFAMTNPRMRLTSSVLYRYEVRESSGTSLRSIAHMKRCVESYMQLFETVHGLMEQYPAFEEGGRSIAAGQMIPFFSRVLSSAPAARRVKELRGRLQALGMYPVRGKDLNKCTGMINFLLSNPWLCVLASTVYRHMFVPYVLPRLSRN